MKQCALYVCYRNGPQHPLIDNAAHAAASKLNVLTHGVFIVHGGPILGKNFRKMVARNVRQAVIQTKSEANQWQPAKNLTPKDDITLAQTIDMLVGEWVGKLRMPPDALEVWLVPIQADDALDKANANCVRYNRSVNAKNKFTQTLTTATPLPDHVTV